MLSRRARAFSAAIPCLRSLGFFRALRPRFSPRFITRMILGRVRS